MKPSSCSQVPSPWDSSQSANAVLAEIPMKKYLRKRYRKHKRILASGKAKA